MKRIIYLGLLAVLMTGCYAMPNECDFSVVPSTNNPDYTGGRGSSSSAKPSMPQVPGGF